MRPTVRACQDHAELSHIAHTDHPIAVPLDDDSVGRLLARAVPPDAARALDLGCGGGEWLLRALATHSRLRADGIDIAEHALARATQAAHDRGVADRFSTHQADAAGFVADGSFDLVISVGAAHVFGGLLSTRAELDDYEWAWTGSLAAWALDHPDHPDRAQALAAATEHRDGWLRGYRECFGFVCLVLRPTSG